MAEGEGFEPPEAVKPLTISSRAHSTTLPTLRVGAIIASLGLVWQLLSGSR